MIVPIDSAKLGHAIDLLAEGFPAKPRAFWAECIARMERFGANAECGVPFGVFMMNGDAPTAIALTLASKRRLAGGDRTIVNFAAWYVKPEARARAPMMLRAIARLPYDVVTDLTPSVPVQALLPTFGFKPMTAGFSADLAPLSALRPSDAHIEPLDPGAGGVEALLTAHEPFGAMTGALVTREARIPFMFKTTRWRGLTAARLLYCGSNRVVLAHPGAIARFLVRRGAQVVLYDLPRNGPIAPGWRRGGRGLRFARGDVNPELTDYAGSELALFDL